MADIFTYSQKFSSRGYSPLPLERGGSRHGGRRGVGLLTTMLLSLLLAGNVHGQTIKVINPFLTSPTHLFTSKLTYKENTFSGYLGVKYTDANNFRISFNSTMGSTLMDLEWKDGEFIKHYLPEQLNRKIIINKLQEDFEMMLLHILAEGRWKNNNTLKIGCHKYQFEKTNNLPTEIIDRNWIGRKKRSLSFDYTEEKNLRGIRLKHHSFALQMELSSIE
jgi:hypothetical protein